MTKMDEFLKSLGNTADEVAAYLRGAGIKGRKRNMRSCPIAELINTTDITWPGIRVQTYAYKEKTKCHVWIEDDQIVGADWTAPDPVTDFVVKFDAGLYPDLVAER